MTEQMAHKHWCNGMYTDHYRGNSKHRKALGGDEKTETPER